MRHGASPTLVGRELPAALLRTRTAAPAAVGYERAVLRSAQADDTRVM
jgi:hypothetical protein